MSISRVELDMDMSHDHLCSIQSRVSFPKSTVLFSRQSGLTALIWAALSGYTDCVRVLVQAGAEKDTKTRDVRDVYA